VAKGEKASEPGTMSKLPPGLYQAELNSISAIFGGWYTDEGLTESWNFSDSVTGNLNLYAKWTMDSAIDISGQSGTHTLAKALGYIAAQAPSEPTAYTIVLDRYAETYTMPGIMSANINTANAIITLVGKVPTEISLSSNGSLFYITAGELVLDDNITLKGRSNNSVLVYVNGSSASLTMKTGAKIIGNKNTAQYNYSSYGGGVYVYSGRFTMSGGEISGNTAVSDSGSSTSTYSSYGGGVCVGYGGNFTMSGGEIFNNTAYSYSSSTSSYVYATSWGGGVYVSGNFTMSDGIISGNTASALHSAGSPNAYAGSPSYGGGVCIYNNGSFSKTGGSIISDYNPVYYYHDDSNQYYRKAALNAGDSISTSDTLPAVSGQTIGYWTKR
jgi:uncharacterized repeat protein (TIGR02543 family)